MIFVLNGYWGLVISSHRSRSSRSSVNGLAHLITYPLPSLPLNRCNLWMAPVLRWWESCQCNLWICKWPTANLAAPVHCASSLLYTLYYGNMGCQVFKRGIKNTNFLAKNQLIKGKYCIFFIWCSKEVAKSAKMGLWKSIFSIKNYPNLLNSTI